MLQVCYCQYQCGGGIGLCDGSDDLVCLCQCCFGVVVFVWYDLCDQFGMMQLCEVFVWKLVVDVVVGCIGGEFGGEVFELCGEVCVVCFVGVCVCNVGGVGGIGRQKVQCRLWWW